MGRPVAEVEGKAHRPLGDHLTQKSRLYDHLAGEFHARTGEAQSLVAIASQGPQPTMGVSDAGMEQEVEQTRKQRIADVPILPGHGARLDAAGEAVAHAKAGAFDQSLDHRRGLPKVVGAVGVAHDEISPARRSETATQGRAIALFQNRDHAGAEASGYRRAAIRAAVVGDHDLAR